MTTIVQPADVAEEVIPGVYDIPAEMYHADPIPGGSLSSTGARTLTSACPAKFRYDLDHQEPYKAVFEFGTAAHKVVLDDGPELVLVDAPRWDTTVLKAKVAKIRAAGNIPLKQRDLDRVHDMATALAAHPEASDLLTPGSGQSEQTLIWRTGNVWRRARVDWLRPDELVDYKTCRSAHPDAIAKAMLDHGYPQQDDWYRAGAIALGLVREDAPFKFVFQEKEPPYLVTVAELDFIAKGIGHELNRRALFLYEYCRETGNWPAYATETSIISLPAWVERQFA